MRIITLDTLKTMPNGTVFCRIGEDGNIDWELTILTGRYENRSGFNQTMSVLPEDPYYKMFYLKDEKGNYLTDNEFETTWGTFKAKDEQYSKEMHFIVFSKAEVEKMIKALQWGLSGLTKDFDMDEILR